MHICIAHIASKVSLQRKPLILDINPSIVINFGGQAFEDEHTIASYDNIKDGNNIWMVIFPRVSRTKYRIFVSIYHPSVQNEIIDLDILYYDTVAEVKQAISERTSIPTSNQRIIFASKQLEDAHVFSD